MGKISIYLILFFSLMSSLQAATTCDVVAIVFDTKICQEEIAVPLNKNRNNPEKDQEKYSKAKLVQRIQDIAAQHLLKKESYTPTNEEVERYRNFLEKAKAWQVAHHQESVALIEKLLSEYEYSERHRKHLESILESYRKILRQSGKREEEARQRDENLRKRFGEDTVKELHESLEKGRDKMARYTVARWKKNKALYEKYGGRVIFQQAGIEPIDAYRAQLRDIRKLGRLQILKPEFQDIFAPLERYLDMGHNYLPDTKEKKYFSKPYWETANPDEAHQKSLNSIRAIPHL